MKVINFLKSEKWTLMSLFLMVLSVVIGSPMMLAAEGGLAVTEETPSASEGHVGLETQVGGSPTTVSTAKDAGGDLVQPDIDDQIFEIGTDETVLDGIMRKAKRKVKVTGYEVDHYVIDEQKAYSEVKTQYDAATQKSATLTVLEGDEDLFQENGTIIAVGVSGYTEDGQTELPGSDLMLFISGKDTSGNPIVRAINGPKTAKTDMYCNIPTIPAGTKLIILANACAETQLEVAPDMVVPVAQRVYLQKMIMNQLVSDYFNAQKKRIPFAEATIAEAMIKQYRRKCNRTLWIGRKGIVNVNRGKMGTQKIYFTEGIRWQFKREWEHTGAWTFADIIALAKLKFTGQNCSKSAVWLMGRDLLEQIQNIDFTKHKDITMTSDEFWGFACTKLHTVFGDLHLIHEPTLDIIGYPASGGIIDETGIVRYFLKNEEATQEDIEGEEAKRKAIVSINALALKGYSHIWVNGDAEASRTGVMVVTEWNDPTNAPSSPNTDQVFYLKQACTGIAGSKAGEMWKYNGTGWEKYKGEIYVTSSAA